MNREAFKNSSSGRVRRLQALRETYRHQIQRQTQAAAVLQVVDLLFARPVLTVNQTAANRHISLLADQGLLQEIAGQARNRIYRATEIIAAIDDPLF